MPRFGPHSIAHLADVDPRLRTLFNEVIKHWDCQVIDGRRTVAEQAKNVAKGVSKTMKSKHLEGLAVDVMPYPYDWNKIEKGLLALKKADPTMQIAEVYMFIGFVRGIAISQGIDLRQGADWDSDNQFEDHTFVDLPHHEIDE